MNINQTTVAATTAGGALGVVVTWVISAATGADVPAEVGAAISTVGAFFAGLVFPGR